MRLKVVITPFLVALVIVFLHPVPMLGDVVAGPKASSISVIPFQGRLTDEDGMPVSGPTAMTFRIYSESVGGDLLWEEIWTGANEVNLTSDGLFKVELGKIEANLGSSLADQDELWLGILVGGEVGEMEPRVQLGSVPFSLWALTVADGAITGDKIAQAAIDSNHIAEAGISLANHAPQTGIYWKAPPYVVVEVETQWYPTNVSGVDGPGNENWNISAYLDAADVPDDASVIILGWRPSCVGDGSSFIFLAENGASLGTMSLGTAIPRYDPDNIPPAYPGADTTVLEVLFSPTGPEYGTPIPVPGNTAIIRYDWIGTYRHVPSDLGNARRILIVYGWSN